MRIAFLITFAISLIVYTLTLAPTVTMEYSGVIVTAADSLGVGRCPVEPLWTLLAWLFQNLFGFVTYHGHSNPAWGVNFMSAFFGALSCAMVAVLVEGASCCKAAGPAVRPHPRILESCCGISAGLLFGFSPVMWSQSVIAESYTLAVFLLLVILWSAYRWLMDDSKKHFYLMSFAYGLEMTCNWTAFVLLPLFIFLFMFKIRKWKDFGQMPVFIVLVLLALSTFFFAVFSSEQNPPINWGNARTAVGFLHNVTRGQHEKVEMVNPFQNSDLIMTCYRDYVKGLINQFTLPIALTALLSVFTGVSKRWLFLLWTAFLLMSFVLMLWITPESDNQTQFIVRTRWLFSYAVFAVLIGMGLRRLVSLVYRCHPAGS